MVEGSESAVPKSDQPEHEAVVVVPELGEMVQVVAAEPKEVPETAALRPESHVGGPTPLVDAWYESESW